MSKERARHIVNVSGGKDSTALAIYPRDRIADLEYVFCDTGRELPETYDYLLRIEAFLGRPVVRLNAERGFDHWFTIFGKYLPSPRARWCTKLLKLKPFEAYVGDDPVMSYVGIRADEDREGYVSHKPSITARFPFKEDGIVLEDVYRILEESGVGLPEYYTWRSRSGCFFCFFQQKIEWVGLLRNHPDFFAEAMRYETLGDDPSKKFTWSAGETLEQLSRPERIAQIEADYQESVRRHEAKKPNRTLAEVLGATRPSGSDGRACIICDL